VLCRREQVEKIFFVDWTETCESFEQMGLQKSLLRGVYAHGAITSRVPNGPFGILADTGLAGLAVLLHRYLVYSNSDNHN
jgi:hypothetical protein